MWFTIEELKWISLGVKRLTIRQFTKSGRMPIKIGSKTFLKTGSFVSPERYGQIQIKEAEIKSLREMTNSDAVLGGYDTSEAYIHDQLNEYNANVDLDTKMIFYTFEVLWIDEELINAL